MTHAVWSFVLGKFLNMQNVCLCMHNDLCCRLEFYVSRVFGGMLLRRLDGVGQRVQEAKNRYSLQMLSVAFVKLYLFLIFDICVFNP